MSDPHSVIDAPNLLQLLKDHKSGKKKLSATRVAGVRAVLRKVMTPAEINAALKKA